MDKKNKSFKQIVYIIYLFIINYLNKISFKINLKKST